MWTVILDKVQPNMTFWSLNFNIFVLMTNLHARRDELRRMKWPVSWRGGRSGRWQSLWSTLSWGGGGWQGQLWSLQLLGWINSLEGSPVRNQMQWGSWKWDVCRQCRQDAHLHLGFEINQQVWRELLPLTNQCTMCTLFCIKKTLCIEYRAPYHYHKQCQPKSTNKCQWASLCYWFTLSKVYFIACFSALAPFQWFRNWWASELDYW